MNLNSNQLAAVQYFASPMLIVAGAGTGKTSTIVAKILHAINTGFAEPHNILATTFTNKAAYELKSRLQEHLGNGVSKMMIGTFHSLSLEILQRYYASIGSTQTVSVLPYEDQIQVVRGILTKLNLKDLKPSIVLEKIQKCKEADLPFGLDQQIFLNYQEELNNDKMMDFADLLLNVIKLFKSNHELREYYQKTLKMVCIDEYQDINDLQHKWMSILLDGNNHLCCVGDPDQAIYAFRGANASHILNFERHFKDAKVVKLEQNYRSVDAILRNANKLIEKNKNRIPKALYSNNPSAERSVSLYSAPSARIEAAGIADKISKLLGQSSDKTIAILVRSRMQIPDIEEALINRRISYTVSGAVQFLDRAEIKDMLSYFRFLYNPSDSLAFKRMLQSPRRGLGQVAIDRILEEAKAKHLDLLQASHSIAMQSSKIVQEKILAVVDLLNEAQKMLGQSLAAVANLIYVKSGYIDSIAEERRDNVNQWIRSLVDFTSLSDYIQQVLWQIDNSTTQTDVILMTIHAAKGLEFDHVFLAGWEEGVLPHEFARSSLEVEEERRLAYVALTRARSKVFISHAASRLFNGRLKQCLPSRFLRELDHIERDSLVPDAIPIGADVSHPRFGMGTIEQISQDFARVKFIDATRLVETRILRRL